jgi:hypothetical protein
MGVRLHGSQAAWESGCMGARATSSCYGSNRKIKDRSYGQQPGQLYSLKSKSVNNEGQKSSTGNGSLHQTWDDGSTAVYLVFDTSSSSKGMINGNPGH